MAPFGSGDPVFGGQIFSPPDEGDPPIGSGDAMLFEDGFQMLFENGLDTMLLEPAP